MKAKCSYCGFRGEPVNGKCIICDTMMEVQPPMKKVPEMEKKNGVIKRMFSFFKKKVDDKKIETSEKTKTGEKTKTKERSVVDSTDRTTDKVATVRTARKTGRTEVEMKKCPYCGSDLSSDKNVRSRQNKDRVSADEEDDSESEKKYQSNRLMIGNIFFPDTLTLSSEGISFREGSLLGSKAKRINYREVALVRVKRGILFSDVRIELVRKPPILLDGLFYDEAKEIKDTISSILTTAHG